MTTKKTPVLFATLTKVDVARQEVWGRMTEEIPDNAKEICDYATTKPFVKAWSESFAKVTGGKSLGNVRAMHGKIAAGKVIHVEYNDVEKAIDIGTKITDNNEFQKCLDGTYTGFSIGGRYADKWPDPINKTLTRYTADPGEVSLADKPCVPSALFFDIVKTDGSVSKTPFVTQEEAVEKLYRKLDDGTITPKSLLMLVEKAETEDGEVIEADEITDDDKPDDVSDDEWAAMDPEEKAQAVADAIDAAKTDQSKMTKGDTMKKPDSIAQDKWDAMSPEDKAAACKAPADDAAKVAGAVNNNAAVEAEARKLCKADPASNGADANWQNYVGPAIRALAKAEFTATPTPGAFQFNPDMAKALQALAFMALAGDTYTAPAPLLKWLADGVPLLAAEKTLPQTGVDSLKNFKTRVDIAKTLDNSALTAEQFDSIVFTALGEEGIAKVSINGVGVRDALKNAVLAKYGARNSATDAANLQAAHDAISACGAVCTAADATITATLKTDTNVELMKVVAALQNDMKKILEQPRQRKGVLNKVNSEQDDAAPAAVAAPGTHNEAAAHALIKTQVAQTAALRKF